MYSLIKKAENEESSEELLIPGIVPKLDPLYYDRYNQPRTWKSYLLNYFFLFECCVIAICPIPWLDTYVEVDIV